MERELSKNLMKDMIIKYQEHFCPNLLLDLDTMQECFYNIISNYFGIAGFRINIIDDIKIFMYEGSDYQQMVFCFKAKAKENSEIRTSIITYSYLFKRWELFTVYGYHYDEAERIITQDYIRNISGDI